MPSKTQLWLCSGVLARVLLILSLRETVRGETSTPHTGDQLQGFTFSYGLNTSHLVLPTIYSCPSPIVISSLTPTNKGGPDPIAPYTLVAFVHEQLMDGAGQRYERTYIRSINLGNLNSATNVMAPWMEGTQFIGCVWSANDVSGGCQDLMTVVSEGSRTEEAYEDGTSECRKEDVMASWVTDPGKTLEVDVQGPSGTISTNAWPASCSDLRFTPKNGTAPYTLVIAPAFHPPINITSSGGDNSMNYTIRLTHGQAFMAGIVDSQGNSWAIGPLHAGVSSSLGCLATKVGQKWTDDGSIGVGAMAGSVVGAFVLGALGALLLSWFISKRRKKPIRGETRELLSDPYSDPRPASYRADSGISVYQKPLSPNRNAYSDLSPPMLYDTPSMLYDPALNQPVTNPLSPSTNNGVRPFPRPPPDVSAYPTPYDYRQPGSPGQEDFQPLWAEGSSIYGTRTPDQRDSMSSLHPRQGSAGRNNIGRMHAVGGSAMSNRSPSFHEDDEDGPLDSLGRRTRNVYVVHSDGGGGDLHIRLPEGQANVIELPPDYRNDPRPVLPMTGSDGLGGAIIPQSPPPGSIHSMRSLQEAPNLRPLPTHELHQIASRGSGYSELTPDEVRARAEAALAEKGRPLSAGVVPRPRGS